MIDYSKKYLKYKTKYLELKNFQSGGGREHNFCLITGQITDQLIEKLKELEQLEENRDMYFIFACPPFNWLLWRLNRIINNIETISQKYKENEEIFNRTKGKEKEKEREQLINDFVDTTFTTLDNDSKKALKEDINSFYKKKDSIPDLSFSFNKTLPGKSILLDVKAFGSVKLDLVSKFKDGSKYALDLFSFKKISKLKSTGNFNKFFINLAYHILKYFFENFRHLITDSDNIDNTLKELDKNRDKDQSLELQTSKNPKETFYSMICNFFEANKEMLDNFNLNDGDEYTKYKQILDNYSDEELMKKLFKGDQNCNKDVIKLLSSFTPFTSTPSDPAFMTYVLTKILSKSTDELDELVGKSKEKPVIIKTTEFDISKLDISTLTKVGKIIVIADLEKDDLVALNMLEKYGEQHNMKITFYSQLPASFETTDIKLKKKLDNLNKLETKLKEIKFKSIEYITHFIDKQSINLENIANVDDGELKFLFALDRDKLGCNRQRKIFFITDLEGDMRPLISSLIELMKESNIQSRISDKRYSMDLIEYIVNGYEDRDKEEVVLNEFRKKLTNTKSDLTHENILDIFTKLGFTRLDINKVLQEYVLYNALPLRISKNTDTDNKKLLSDLMQKLMAEFPSNPNPYVNLLKDLKFEVNIKNDWHFVFGGDVGDHGFYTLRLKKLLVDLKRSYPDNVTLLIGNRDANKIRFYQELYKANSRFQTYRQEIYQAQWTRKRKIDLRGLKEDKITLLKHVLAVEMGSPNDFEYRKIELQQLLGKVVDDYLVWLSFIVESVPISKYEKLIDEDDRKLLKDLGYVIGISFEYLRNAEYIKKLDKTLVTHSNLMDNSGNPEAGDFKDEEGKEIKIQEVVKTGYINNETIREVAGIVQNELNEYESNLKPLDFSNDYNTWFGSRPGGLLMASACPIAFTHRGEYEKHCMDKYGKELFHWGYCRYRESDTLMPKKLSDELIEQLKNDGIKFILTGHTPQPVPIVALKHNHDIYLIGADTSYGCFDKPSNKDRRLNSGSGLVVNGDKCTVYGNLGKKLTDDNTFVNNKDDSITVKYDIKKDIGTSTEIENEKIKDIKIKDKTIFEGKKCIITGYYNENPIAMIRNDINMYPFINKKSK